MLTIVVPAKEFCINRRFFNTKETTLRLEHSLVSISKWEQKWQVPFLNIGPQNSEQTLDYIRCMTITQNVDPMVYKALTPDNVKAVQEYIQNPSSASKFYDTELGKIEKKKKSGSARNEIMTSEKLYALMTQYRINWDAEKWHINRLIALIEYCGQMNQPPKKLDTNDRIALMQANKAKYGGGAKMPHGIKKPPTRFKR